MNFKSYCKRNGISAEQLANMCDVSPAAAYSWLADKNYPTYKTIIFLLQQGMRIDEIFDESVLKAVRCTHADDFSGIDLQLTPENCQKIVKAGLTFLKAQGDDPTISVK